MAVYHDTPHSVTGEATKILKFGRAKTSGLQYLEIVGFLANKSEFYKQAWELRIFNWKLILSEWRTYLVNKWKSINVQLRSGDKFLFKKRKNKSTNVWKDMSHCGPNPFTIIAIKGFLVKANSIYPRQQFISRKSSC